MLREIYACRNSNNLSNGDKYTHSLSHSATLVKEEKQLQAYNIKVTALTTTTTLTAAAPAAATLTEQEKTHSQ